MQWILSPITQYAILAAGLIGALVMFFSVKVEMSTERRRTDEVHGALEEQVREMESAMAGIRKTVVEIEERPAAVSAGLTSTKRAQAIRMHRRGEPIESIAATLSTSRSAIDLMLKVQKMVQDRSDSPTA